jgi:thiamine biosynthesis protein ThiS
MDRPSPVRLEALATPALLVDLERFDRNVARMRSALARAGNVTLRPHLKTVKSAEAARRILGPGGGPVTVSTLLERLEIDPRRVAIEHNLEIIRRRTFETVVVKDGDRLEIVNAVGGG